MFFMKLIELIIFEKIKSNKVILVTKYYCYVYKILGISMELNFLNMVTLFIPKIELVHKFIELTYISILCKLYITIF